MAAFLWLAGIPDGNKEKQKSSAYVKKQATSQQFWTQSEIQNFPHGELTNSKLKKGIPSISVSMKALKLG